LREIREQLERPFEGLPPELAKSWSQNRVWKFASEQSVVVGTGAFTTGQALFHLSRHDNQVFDAIDTIYKPGAENSFAEITEHLRTLSGGTDSMWAGGLAAYKGRLGEDYMAEYLNAAGHNVELATSANQEGWDAIVDGQLVNFKAGLGTEHIQEHLERFPDIPVITVAEQAQNFADYDGVTCLMEVSGEEIGRVTEDAMGNAVEATDFGLDIPLITLALSAVRNFKPVFAGHSGFSTAAINTTADTAGVGFGAAIGAKVGSLMGLAGGPIGVAVGGIIGGIGGAFGGSSMVKVWKERALKEALASYEEQVSEYGHAYLNALEAKAGSLERSASQYQRPFSLWHFLMPSPSDLIRDAMREAYLKWALHCRAEARRLLAEKTAKKQNEQVFCGIGTKLIQKGPSEPVYHPEVESCMQRIRKSLERILAEKRRLGYAS
jgi:hypothetical protein